MFVSSAFFDARSNGQLHGQQTEERGELDDRVERDRRRVFEWVADRIADHGGIVQRRALLLEFDFDDLFRVVPRAAGVGRAGVN